MAKCKVCKKEIPNSGLESQNWSLVCKECGTVDKLIDLATKPTRRK
jgi:translation initiation factor 2 beta subunit (eIF-2beta)/eIF-5